LTGIRIDRSPQSAESESFDIAVVGGGIYGAMVLLSAARLGLRAILLEKNDFGSATSFNSLRIIHGGRRYLQSADFQRVIGMIRQRAWFLENFPDLVQLLPCLMPVYNSGARRTSTLRVALEIDNFLNRSTNSRLSEERRIPPGYVTDNSQTRQLFPSVRASGLKGGAIWCDVHAPDSQRLVIEVLRWASAAGAIALNYVAVDDLLTHDGTVVGVRATDTVTGGEVDIRARVVVNAAGPASRDVARKFDKDFARLFRPSLAWNVILERPPLSDHALAVSRRDRNSHTYFVVPWKGKLMVGTGHSSFTGGARIEVGKLQIDEMLEDLNAAIPGIGLAEADVSGILAGLLPVRREGGTSLSPHESVIDHGQLGGPDGLISVSGVKMFASQQVAARVLGLVARRFFRARSLPDQQEVRRPSPGVGWDLSTQYGCESASLDEALERIKTIIDEESVVHLDDIVFRRTTLWENARYWADHPEPLLSLFEWDAETRARESSRLVQALSSFSIP
jgi:glycerol-3-phosphate dehydrogenase